MMPNEGYFSSLKSFFLPKSVGETPTYFFIFFLFQTCLNSLPRGVEPKPAGCYPGALTTRLETLWLCVISLREEKVQRARQKSSPVQTHTTHTHLETEISTRLAIQFWPEIVIQFCCILLERSPFWPLDSSICQIFTLTPISSKNGISTIFTIHFWPEIVILSLCMASLAKKQEATCRKTAAKSSKNQWK